MFLEQVHRKYTHAFKHNHSLGKERKKGNLNGFIISIKYLSTIKQFLF